MTTVHTRLSILSDISQLHPRLRKEDRDEVMAMGLNPRTALMGGYLNGECHTGLYGDTVICMYGVVPETNGGRVWMLSCEDIERHGLSVSRITRKEIKRFSSQYPQIYNVVDTRNTMTIKWLKWLGFSFGATHLIGSSNQPFKEFVLWQCN